MNVTIPICSTMVVNRGKHIYQSDGEKFYGLLSSKNPITAKKSHSLSACLMVHPLGDRYDQMNIRINEWIEYGQIMGFEHFYVYDHMDGSRENGDKFIWDAVYHYIKHHGKVTYIEWPFPYSKPWIFEYSFINSCLNRFKYDNDYIAIVNVDEYIIPPKQFITVLDVLNHINSERKRHVNMFVLKCKMSTTCVEKRGCGDGSSNSKVVFSSFLERHSCLSEDANPKKYIINPMAMWYAFVHGIPRWKDNVDTKAEVFTHIGLCLHASDQYQGRTAYDNDSVDHVVDFLKYAWTHDHEIHPLLDENRRFCPL